MYRQKLEALKDNYKERVWERDRLIKDLEQLQVQVTEQEKLSLSLTMTTQLLDAVSSEARDKAKNQLESVVTSALQYVFGGDHEFKIDMLNRGKPSCEFYVISKINGIESKQKPQDACGGGFVDIISVALRYVYINAFHDPSIKNAVLLDEPGKMVSELASIRFGEFIKFLGKSFDRQTIMVTHNDSLVGIADKTTVVTISNGVSRVSQKADIDLISTEELEDILGV